MKTQSPRSAADYLKQWGHATSIALLGPSAQFFSIPNIDGAVGYRVGAGCAVVFGDPMCDEKDTPQLIDAFHSFCKKKLKSVIYLGASEKFLQCVLGSHCRTALEIGTELIIDPTQDLLARTGPTAVVLRNKHKQAVREGLTVHEYTGQDVELEKKLEAVGAAWLQLRKGPQVYLNDVAICSHRDHKRIFYTKKQEEIVGVLVMTRLDTYAGWVINFSLTVPQAPRVTSEFMLLEVLSVLGKEQCRFFSIGVYPTDNLGRIVGLGRISRWALRNIFPIATKLFKVNSRQRFWKKFEPRHKAAFLIFSKSRIGLREVIGFLRAMNLKMRVQKRPTRSQQVPEQVV